MLHVLTLTVPTSVPVWTDSLEMELLVKVISIKAYLTNYRKFV